MSNFTNLADDLDRLIGEIRSFLQEYEDRIPSEIYDEMEAIADRIEEELNK